MLKKLCVKYNGVECFFPFVFIVEAFAAPQQQNVNSELKENTTKNQIDEILDRRITKNHKPEYLIKWKDSEK